MDEWGEDLAEDRPTLDDSLPESDDLMDEGDFGFLPESEDLTEEGDLGGSRFSSVDEQARGEAAED